MLVEFRVRNHRSLREEQVLNLEAAGERDESDPRPRRGGHRRPLLPAIAIYGANASGKSNVLAALSFMQDAVTESHRFWDPEGGVPRDPFAWGPMLILPSLYEATFYADDVRYQYGFVVDDGRFLEEWLYAWPQGRKQVWFEREEDKFKFGEHLHGENRLIERTTRPNALFLSTAVQQRHMQLAPVYHWLSRLAVVNTKRDAAQRHGYARRSYRPVEYWLRDLLDRSRAATQTSLFTDGTETADARLDRLRAMLRAADVGIVDLKVVESNAATDEPDEPIGRVRRRSRVLVRHRSSEGEAWLPLEEESNGTRTLFTLANPILEALGCGGVLAVDELESSLHPLLAAHVVKQFNDPATNPCNAQLIFATHDTNLLGTTLGEPLLRRDQVWLTEKDENGATCLYPLSDYKPRKVENLERGYLQGRYGAIPFLGTLAPRREP